MRSFFAILCPPEHSTELAEIRDEIDDLDSFKPVRPKNLHLTLKFLGDMTSRNFEDFDSLLQRRLPTTGPLDIRIRGVGTFPDLRDPSVVWAGVEESDDLRKIHDTIEEIAVELGFEPEDHEFQPHITLGRIKGSLKNKEQLVRWMEHYGDQIFGTYTVDNISLFESDLQPDGPVYHELASWPI